MIDIEPTGSNRSRNRAPDGLGDELVSVAGKYTSQALILRAR